MFLSIAIALSVFLPANSQSSDPAGKPAIRPGVCDREAEKLLGQKPVRVGGSVPAPKKLRDVRPKYPELPSGTLGSGMWLGEALIDSSGKVARVWPLREVRLVPPLPAFTDAIMDAVRQWEFEPVLVKGKAVSVCIVVTVHINWH
jgi:hypothetical protein